ncbi:MAG: type IV secretory system conjugative DNA transfer family protein, partial [Bacilli bacterium]
MDIKIFVVLILIVIIPIFLYLVEPYVGFLFRTKVKNSNEHGSARFSTIREIKKNFAKESISNIKEAGVPILFSKDLNYVWVDNKTPHYLYLGSSGSGKTVTAVIPLASFIATAKTPRSLFITDPKGEIYSATSKMFADNGYKVYTIDFRNPSLSNRINLLQSVIKEHDSHIENEKQADYFAAKQEQPHNDDELNIFKAKEIQNRNASISHLAETNKLITATADMLTTEKGTSGDSKFWNNSAGNLLQGLIGLFLEDYKAGKIPKEKITLTSVKKFQNSFMEDDNFDTFTEYLQSKAYGMKSKDSLTSIVGASENTFKSICSVFSERMALFDNITVANITSISDFELDVLGKEKSVLYVIIPDEDKTYYGI